MAKSKEHPGLWFPFYGEKFIAATIGLSFLESGAYAKMIPMYFEVGPFPADKIRLYRILGCESDEHKRAVDHVLQEFFVLREDGWYQEFAEGVKVQMAQRSMQAQERGRRSAKAREAKYGTAQPTSRNAFESVSKAFGNAPELDTGIGTKEPTVVHGIPSPVGGSGGADPGKSQANARAPKGAPPAKRETGTAIPEDWKLPRSWGQWAIAEVPHLTVDDVRAMGEEFRDHYWANRHRKECRRADWLATWRNWVRKDHRTRRARPTAPANLSKQAALEARNDAAMHEWLARHNAQPTDRTDEGVIDAHATERPA